MLIGCISNQDPKREIAIANEICDGIELKGELLKYRPLAKKPLITDVIDYHNYESTPDDLEAILSELLQRKGAYYKIATYARSYLDAIKMLLFTQKVRKKGIHFAGMCMGPKGAITRILSPYVDSSLTYAAIGKPTAPGQLSAKLLIETYQYRQITPQTPIYWGFEPRERHEGLYLPIPLMPDERQAFKELADQLGLIFTLQKRVL